MIVAEYDYRDESGVLLYQAIRYVPKGFHQRRPDGGGGWIWKLDEEEQGIFTRRVLYRLPELLAADPASPVLVVEGEKDVERARALGLIATCNVGGAGKWRADYSEALSGRQVFVLPDNDEPGRSHARKVADSCSGVAANVRVIDLPGLAEHGDLSDWLNDHTAADLLALCSEEPIAAAVWPEPEDRGEAVLSEQGTVEIVEDLARPGRILVWAAEEGTGKSFAVDGELGIRVAVAGGSFAGTWPVIQTGPVLVLSEMHSDDDYERESTVLKSLELDRAALKGRYYRLSLMTAANGAPVLAEAGWRAWAVEWCKQRGIVLLIFDTATGATQVDPWGREIQSVFRNLRLMLAECPGMAVVLVVHCKKPQGHGERRISDVLGEWGRWCDVVVLQERDGIARTRLTTFKRVRHERRIVATKQNGLLVDPKDIGTETGPKVPLDEFVSAVVAEPGLTQAELADRFKVAKRTVASYIAAAVNVGHVYTEASGQRGAFQVFPTDSAPRNRAEPRNVMDCAVVAQSDDGTAQPRNPIYRLRGASLRGDGLPCEECREPLVDDQDRQQGMHWGCARKLVTS